MGNSRSQNSGDRSQKVKGVRLRKLIGERDSNCGVQMRNEPNAECGVEACCLKR